MRYIKKRERKLVCLSHTKLPLQKAGGRQTQKLLFYDSSDPFVGGALSRSCVQPTSKVDNFLYIFLLPFSENFVVMWKKVEPGKNAGDILAMGDNVLNKQDSRVSVEINREGDKKGSTLVIALAEDSDAGHYVCQLGSNEKKELKHTVTIRGK